MATRGKATSHASRRPYRRREKVYKIKYILTYVPVHRNNAVIYFVLGYLSTKKAVTDKIHHHDKTVQGLQTLPRG